MRESPLDSDEFRQPHGRFLSRDDAAFTRLELAVVLAVLALAVLLLLPAMARGRVGDQSFQCRNNLRQLMQAWRMYAADNNDRLAESMGTFGWVGNGFLSPATSNTDNTNVLYLLRSVLWPYVRSLPTFKCPADQSYGVYGGAGRLPRVRSYSMSQAIGTIGGGAGQWLPSPPWRVYAKLSDLTTPTPAGLWVFLDEHPDSINDGGFAVRMDTQGTNATWVDIPAHYHEGACGFSFADGHTEVRRWEDPRTILLFPVTYRYGSTLNIVVSNSPDIAWVQASTSAR